MLAMIACDRFQINTQFTRILSAALSTGMNSLRGSRPL